MQQKPVISIVDDDELVRESLMDLIRAMGYIAETFARADDFLKSTRLHSTSCLITDVRMPGITGLELCERLVNSGNIIPTIVITAYPDEKDRTRALAAGVICYLAKPFDEDDFVVCLRSALETEGKSQEE